MADVNEINEVKKLVLNSPFGTPFFLTENRTDDEVFCCASDYEDGTSSTIMKADGKWYYRIPSTGNDHLVKGGIKEVIAHWKLWLENWS